MKNLILFLALGCYSTTYSQSENAFYGDVQGGAGTTVQGEGLFHGTAGFNAVLKKHFYLRLGADLALGGSFKNPNAVIGYRQYNLRVGINRGISESFSVRPYAGFGYQTLIRTTSVNNATVDGLGALGVDVEPRYESESVNFIVVPIGMDFHIHKKNVGFVAGIYLNASQYTEFGIRLGLTFGKL
ncbi:MAG: hypothetical protein ACJASQ_001206 [Crocinitomicaceae bacterium]|jgi:hypothetical protein